LIFVEGFKTGLLGYLVEDFERFFVLGLGVLDFIPDLRLDSSDVGG